MISYFMLAFRSRDLVLYLVDTGISIPILEV